MPWYAVAAFDDAFDATKALLTPLDAGQWLRLAVVVFFLGSVWGGGPSATAGSSAGGPEGGPPGPPMGDITFPFSIADVLPVVAAVVAVAFVVGLLYAFAASVMEFVFVETLRRQRVRIRRYADQHFEQAVGLFAFRFALGLLVALPVLGVVVGVLAFADGEPQFSVGLALVFVPLILLLGLVVALADTFTTNFVVPVMIRKNVGVLAGWRRFWPALTDQWEQFGVYVLVRIVLQIAVGVLASIVGGIVGALLFAPLAVVGVLTIPALGGLAELLTNPVALAVAAVVLLVNLAILLAVMAVVFVPLQTYLRYHALLVLGDANADFDLIPDLRRDIRER